MSIEFTKLHGAGNDYLYVDGFSQILPQDPGPVIRAMSDRRKGAGSDGLIIAAPSDIADVRMEMYNSDGTRGPMCGNGLRCLTKFTYDHRLIDVTPLIGRKPDNDAEAALCETLNASEYAIMRVETDAGLRVVSIEPQEGLAARIVSDLDEPGFDPSLIPCTLPGPEIIEQEYELLGYTFKLTCVSVGSSHVVAFVDDLDSLPFEKLGPAMETAPIFPDRVNAHFAQVNSQTSIRVLTWERGSGPTHACGTGAAAVCVAGVRAGLCDRSVTIHMPGGDLHPAWHENNHLHLIGPATEVYTAEWDDKLNPY